MSHYRSQSYRVILNQVEYRNNIVYFSKVARCVFVSLELSTLCKNDIGGPKKTKKDSENKRTILAIEIVG